MTRYATFLLPLFARVLHRNVAARIVMIIELEIQLRSKKSTLVDYTINVFVKLHGGVDEEFPKQVMHHCRDVFGSRCVLDNHALSAPLRENDREIYEAMSAMKGPINFQTEAPRGMCCQWRATIAQGVALGAVSIEVWPDAKYEGFTSLQDRNIRELASEFASPIAVPRVEGKDQHCSGFH